MKNSIFPKILLHVCCAPCLVYPLEVLKKERFEVVAFFFNPNIHPYMEFKKRYKCLEEFASQSGLEVIIDKHYGLRKWLDYIENQITYPKRCERCYFLRLKETAKLAKKLGIPYFTTTMLVSPYQRHEVIKEIGESLAQIYGISFFYEDFRKGYKEGEEKARKLGFYMQTYCGCIFSEEEKYYKKRRKEVLKILKKEKEEKR